MSISLRERPLLYDIRGGSFKKMSFSSGCCVMKCQLFMSIDLKLGTAG